EAAGLLTGLPAPWATGGREQAALTPRIAAALAAGWSACDLTGYLTTTPPADMRRPGAVLAYRLRPDVLPDPPATVPPAAPGPPPRPPPRPGTPAAPPPPPPPPARATPRTPPQPAPRGGPAPGGPPPPVSSRAGRSRRPPPASGRAGRPAQHPRRITRWSWISGSPTPPSCGPTCAPG